MEYSKKIIAVLVALESIIMVGVLVWAMVMEHDEIIKIIIPIISTEVTTAAGFYFNKAKAENIRKIEGDNKNEQTKSV